MSVDWVCAARTDVGRLRENNEDAYALNPPVLLVADGLGGHPGGEDASRIAAHTAADVLAGEAPGESALRRAWLAADEAIQEEAAESGRPGMGTTMVGGVVAADDSAFYLANVGDSRAYVLTDDGLRQLTDDDNEAAEMVRRGVITRDEARLHPGRFWLSQALGLGGVVVRTQVVPTQGQRLLLCTDGLLELDDAQVAKILQDAGSPQDAVDALVEAVLTTTEASDNVTVLVADMPGGSG